MSGPVVPVVRVRWYAMRTAEPNALPPSSSCGKRPSAPAATTYPATTIPASTANAYYVPMPSRADPAWTRTTYQESGFSAARGKRLNGPTPRPQRAGRDRPVRRRPTSRFSTQPVTRMDVGPPTGASVLTTPATWTLGTMVLDTSSPIRCPDQTRARGWTNQPRPDSPTTAGRENAERVPVGRFPLPRPTQPLPGQRDHGQTAPMRCSRPGPTPDNAWRPVRTRRQPRCKRSVTIHGLPHQHRQHRRSASPCMSRRSDFGPPQDA